MIRDLIPYAHRALPRLNDTSFLGIRDAVDRVFDNFVSGFDDLTPWTGSIMDMNFTPRLDLEDKGENLILSAELPGLTDKDVHVELDKDLLTIKGEKKSAREEKGKYGFLSERSYGSFERCIRLPSEIVKDKIDATVKNGVLTVTLPKSHEAKKDLRKIAVHN